MIESTSFYIGTLAEISSLASATSPTEETIARGLTLLRDGLGAQDAHLVYASGESFSTLSANAGPDLGLSDIGLWLINRDLTTRQAPCSFNVEDGRVGDLTGLTCGGQCAYVAGPLPVAITSDMVIAHGPWEHGLTQEQRSFLSISLPALGVMAENWLSRSRAQHQSNQLSALANIQRVLSESDNLGTVLTSIARTVATVTGVNYISIDVIDESGRVTLRALNGTNRGGVAALEERWKSGAVRPDPVRDQVLKTRKPMVFPDAQNDERIPAGGRHFFSRTLIRSTGVFPLVSKSGVLGVLSVASHRPLTFTSQEVELLEGLTLQVASAITGVQLYQELDESRDELRRVNQQLREAMNLEHHLARTDVLTSLSNRRYAEETIRVACAHARRYGHPLSVLIADLDHLKEINDGYNHHTGDAALRHVAKCATAACRDVDTVGRYGGDELIFILPSTSLEDAAALAERFRARVEETPIVTTNGDDLRGTVSIGVAQWDDAMDSPDELIRQADHAMYQAKATGRNRTMMAGPGGAARAA